MISDTEEGLLSIYHAMTRSAPSRWRKIELFVSGLGSGTDFRIESFAQDGSRTSFRPDDEGVDAGVKLREDMFRPGTGTWYTATFTVESTGKCDAHYNYDSAPLDLDFDETLEDIRDEALEDQLLFPRDQEHLPEWHPSRN